MDKIIICGNEYNTLVALTEEEQNSGLMFKKVPTVMCFPFKEAGLHKFWMHNTPLPLDIIFCKAGKVVEICSGVPYSLDFVGPNSLTDLVIEVPAGTAARDNIKIGDNVKLKHSVKTMARVLSSKLSLLSKT